MPMSTSYPRKRKQRKINGDGGENRGQTITNSRRNATTTRVVPKRIVSAEWTSAASDRIFLSVPPNSIHQSKHGGSKDRTKYQQSMKDFNPTNMKRDTPPWHPLPLPSDVHRSVVAKTSNQHADTEQNVSVTLLQHRLCETSAPPGASYYYIIRQPRSKPNDVHL